MPFCTGSVYRLKAFEQFFIDLIKIIYFVGDKVIIMSPKLKDLPYLASRPAPFMRRNAAKRFNIANTL